MSYAIRVEGLSKCYRLGALDRPFNTLRDELADTVSHPLRAIRRMFADDRAQTFWALKDLNLEVQQGEVLGVIGRNGAGKSTLLKILSRITDPTHGRALVRGRLASLLEVGTGFHPELSGRENIYLNATILGMRRTEITWKFDEIVAFSGVEKFLDTPVKHYSSGMYVRLAFAVAAHVEADILLVDEVLAVGDAEFQKRCLGKMAEVAKGGRTVLFVSHNMTALRNLCTKGLYLEAGAVKALGSVSDVLSAYGSYGSRNQNAVELPLPQSLPSGSYAIIRKVSVSPESPRVLTRISTQTPFVISMTIEVLRPGVEVGAFINCRNEQGDIVFSTGSFFEKKLNGLRLEQGLHRFDCQVPAQLLNDGEYSLDALLVRDRKTLIATEASLLSFRVEDEVLDIDGWHWRPIGVIRPKLSWRHFES